MKELLVVAITVVVGSVVGYGVYMSQTLGEDNRFQVEKTDGTLTNVDVGPKEGQAKARVEGGDTFDFGTMSKNETKEHTFVIHNDGNSPLFIKLLETSCKCTLAKLEEAEIPPGKSRDLKME